MKTGSFAVFIKSQSCMPFESLIDPEDCGTQAETTLISRGSRFPISREEGDRVLLESGAGTFWAPRYALRIE